MRSWGIIERYLFDKAEQDAGIGFSLLDKLKLVTGKNDIVTRSIERKGGRIVATHGRDGSREIVVSTRGPDGNLRYDGIIAQIFPNDIRPRIVLDK